MYEEDGTGKSRLNSHPVSRPGAMNMLQPNDTLAVVAFGHDAQVIFARPSFPIAPRSRCPRSASIDTTSIPVARQWIKAHAGDSGS